MHSGNTQEYLVILSNTLEKERKYTEIQNKIDTLQIDMLMEKTISTQEENATLTTRIEEYELLKEEGEKREEELKERVNEIKEMAKENKKIETALKTAETKLTATENNIKTQKNNLQNKEEEIARLTEEITKLTAKITQLENELAKQVSRVQTETEQSNHHQQENIRAKKEIEALKEQIKQRETEKKELENTIQESKKAALEKEEAEYKKQRELKRQIEELETRATTTNTAEYNQLKIESEISKAKAQEKEKTIEILQGTIDRLENLLSKQLTTYTPHSAYSSQYPAGFTEHSHSQIQSSSRGPKAIGYQRRAQIEQTIPMESANKEIYNESTTSTVIPTRLVDMVADHSSDEADRYTGITRQMIKDRNTQDTPQSYTHPNTEEPSIKLISTPKSPRKSRPAQRKMPNEPSKDSIRDSTKPKEQISTLSKRPSTQTDENRPQEQIQFSEDSKKLKKPAPAKRKTKAEAMDFKKELSKTTTKKHKPTLQPEEKEAKEKKDFSTLFSKTKSKGVFSNKSDSDSFFANLSFSTYEDSHENK
ncbi:hypothetical protein NEOKW01_0667 [Nematocida sp. AWRm80]|nr:hypothetical protein NEOKW01_0667 [Nematocida sp. AWRm80]